MSSGFVDVGRGDVGTVVRADEGVPGFADAVEREAPGGLAASPEALVAAFVDASMGADGTGAAEGTPLAMVGVDEVAVPIEGALALVVGRASVGFLSSMEITPNVTPMPVSVAIAAVISATPIGRFAGGVGPDTERAAAEAFAAGAPSFGSDFRSGGMRRPRSSSLRWWGFAGAGVAFAFTGTCAFACAAAGTGTAATGSG
jgi:hypothetical protein